MAGEQPARKIGKYSLKIRTISLLLQSQAHLPKNLPEFIIYFLIDFPLSLWVVEVLGGKMNLELASGPNLGYFTLTFT